MTVNRWHVGSNPANGYRCRRLREVSLGPDLSSTSYLAFATIQAVVGMRLR
jgi:hypothetical protein